MKKIWGLLSTATLLPAFGWGASLSGSLTTNVPGTTISSPIVGATVALISGAGSQAVIVGSVASDQSGNYSFDSLEAGFWQVTVSADGYTPNPAVDVFAVNSADTGIVENFVFAGQTGANVPGTSTIGGRITSGDSSVMSATVTLLRRATAASSWVLVDSTVTDENGVYAFVNILGADTANEFANAYAISVNAPGYAPYISGSIAVDDGLTAIANASLATVGLHPAFSTGQGIRFSTRGDQLAVDLGVSNSTRTISVLDLNGTLRQRVSVPAGQSRVLMPAAFAPRNGYLFQVKYPF